MSNLKIALNGRHLFLSMLIVIFFTFTSLSSIFWLPSTSSRASSAALGRFYFQRSESRVSTWSSGWEGFYSPPTPGSPWATFWKDSTKERCRVDLEWTESAQASLTGLWLLCSSRVCVTCNFFLFTCPIHLKANLHRRQLVLQVWFQLSNASTKSRCLPSSFHQMGLQQISCPTALANSLPIMFW